MAADAECSLLQVTMPAMRERFSKLKNKDQFTYNTAHNWLIFQRLCAAGESWTDGLFVRTVEDDIWKYVINSGE